MTETPADTDTQTAETITDEYFEREYSLTAADVGDFLVDLGEQFKTTDELTLTGDGWELPFAFGEPITLDIEFEGSEPELEIEVELAGAVEDDPPALE